MGNEDKELIEYVSELSRVRKSIPNMKSGRTYFILNDNEIIDERVVAFARQGDTDAVIFVNRSCDDIILENISGLMPRFTDLKAMYGQFENDTVTIKPYGYTIISAKFLG